MIRAWKWWRDWSPLFLFPLGLALMMRGMWLGLFVDEYARGTFNLLLGFIIERDAIDRMDATRKRWDAELAALNPDGQGMG